MSTRLSEESVLSSIVKGALVSRVLPKKESEQLLALDVDAVLARPDVADHVPTISPQQLYHGMLRKGVESCDRASCLTYPQINSSAFVIMMCGRTIL